VQPVPHPRFFKLDVERRDRLLEAAAEEFSTHGYDGASLNAVIERLGLSKGQFYYYFDDKADLFGTVLDWAWARVLPEALYDFVQLDETTFWPHFEKLAERSRDVIRTMPWYVGLIRQLFYPPADAAVRGMVEEKLQRGCDLQLALVRRGQTLGCVRSDLPEDLLLTLLNALDGAANRWYLDHWDELESEQRETLTERSFDLVRRAFEPPLSRRAVS
jgi:AcrR family transcriptional regulator